MTSKRAVTVPKAPAKWGEMLLGFTSPWDQKLIITVAAEEALQAWKQPWLECRGAHVPAAVLRRALPGAESPHGKHPCHLGVRAAQPKVEHCPTAAAGWSSACSRGLAIGSTHTCIYPTLVPYSCPIGHRRNEECRSVETKERDRSYAHTWVRVLVCALFFQDSNLLTGSFSGRTQFS